MKAWLRWFAVVWFAAGLISLIPSYALAGPGHDDSSHTAPVQTGEQFARKLLHRYPAMHWAACHHYQGDEAMFVCGFTAQGNGEQCVFKSLLIDTAFRAWHKPIPVSCKSIA